MTNHQSLPPRDGTLDTCFSRWSRKLAAALALGCWGLVLPVQAQYSIDWHKISGGGGTSTGVVYSVSGTIGQPDAGSTMTSEQFCVTGGFWVLPQAVQVEGAPMLSITPAGQGNCTISWTPKTTGFLLQETWNFSPANWTNSPSGSSNPVTLPTGATGKFFRLRKQP